MWLFKGTLEGYTESVHVGRFLISESVLELFCGKGGLPKSKVHEVNFHVKLVRKRSIGKTQNVLACATRNEKRG